MTLEKRLDIIDKEFEFGGVAQLARAIGSYPVGHLFESDRRYHVGAKYALLRFSFAKKNIRPLPCSSFSAKSHARLTCSVASALATAHCRYQLFAGNAPAACLEDKKIQFIFGRPIHVVKDFAIIVPFG